MASGDMWLYRRSVVEWILRPSLRAQLPPAYRALGLLCRTYFRIVPCSRKLRGGRWLFGIAKRVHRCCGDDSYAQIQVEGLTVFVDLTDPRFLAVVNEISQRSETRILSELLSEGDTFVDVGANHGSFSIIAGRLVGTAGRVVAFEPQPRLAEVCRRSLSANGIPNGEVHEVALGDRDGEADLIVPARTSGRAGFYGAFSGRGPNRRVRVPLRRFDASVNWRDFPGSTVVKLDIEGSELSFLRGAGEMLRSLLPPLLIELNPAALSASGTRCEQIRALLSSYGYTSYRELDELNRPRPLFGLLGSPHRNVLIHGRNLPKKLQVRRVRASLPKIPTKGRSRRA